MTKRRFDSVVQMPAGVPRRHYACRMRLDLWDKLKADCLRLNCSQGVYLEILLGKVFPEGVQSVGLAFVSQEDVFRYSSQGEKIK